MLVELDRILYKGTSSNNYYIVLNTGSNAGNKYYLTRATGTVNTNWSHTIPNNKIFFAITKGGSAFHIYGCYCYNSTNGKTVNIKLPSSSNVIYYCDSVPYTYNSSWSDREILYLMNTNGYNTTSISIDQFQNSTDLTSIYLYSDSFTLLNNLSF